MKLLRRALGAVALAVIAAAGLRVRGKGGTPPQHGGWRQLDLGTDPAAGPAPTDTAPTDTAPTDTASGTS